MEAEIGLDRLVSPDVSRLHRGESDGNFVDLFLPATLRRERRRTRLDLRPDLKKFAEEAPPRHGRVAPAEHRNVEQVPVDRRKHLDAGTGSRLEQALGGERFHRLSDDRSAGIELTPEIGLIGERIAGSELATDNAASQRLDDVSEEIALAAGAAKEKCGVEIRHGRER